MYQSKKSVRGCKTDKKQKNGLFLIISENIQVPNLKVRSGID